MKVHAGFLGASRRYLRGPTIPTTPKLERNLLADKGPEMMFLVVGVFVVVAVCKRRSSWQPVDPRLPAGRIAGRI
jgi:hypothetical protein